MVTIIDNFLASLAKLLGPLAPSAKAVFAAALPVAYAIVGSLANHHIDQTQLVAGLTGLALAVVVWLVPNTSGASKSAVGPVRKLP